MLGMKTMGTNVKHHRSRFLRVDSMCLTESGPPVPLSLTQALSGAASRSWLHFLFKVGALSSLWHCWRLTHSLLTRPRSRRRQPRKDSFLVINQKRFSPLDQRLFYCNLVRGKILQYLFALLQVYGTETHRSAKMCRNWFTLFYVRTLMPNIRWPQVGKNHLK